jgi:hypothetical protein
VLLFHAAGNTTSNLLPILPPAAADLRIYYITIVMNWLIALVIFFVSFRSARSLEHIPGLRTSSEEIPT